MQKIDEANKDIDDEVNDVLDATTSSSIESPSKEEELEEGEKEMDEKVDEWRRCGRRKKNQMWEAHIINITPVKEKLAVEAAAKKQRNRRR